jgi:hypothetical protein
MTLLHQLVRQRDYDCAYDISLEALNMLQQLNSRSLSLIDRIHVVVSFDGITPTARALALQTGRGPSKALELLETGRSVILGLLIDDEIDTSKLKVANPSIYNRLQRLRYEVNQSSNTSPSRHFHEDIGETISNAFEELQLCIQQIRHLPGFCFFHEYLTAEQMQKVCEGGRVILVNIAKFRSDAIVVSSSTVEAIHLADIDEVQAKDWVRRNEYDQNNKLYGQFLTWLWRGCVRPILMKLGYTLQHCPEDLPRVWWVGIGPASSFPFHAACDFDRRPGVGAFDYVLSSYSPSIKALAYSQRQVPGNGPLKLLTISMTQTQGEVDLKEAKPEINAVEAAVQNLAKVESLHQPNTATVISHLGDCSLVHFACHGKSINGNPAQSGLLLQGETNPDLGPELLTVRQLCESQCKKGQLAYLSACSTARNPAWDLQDEVIHLTSGFQVAGFRHVIGCLWPSDDNVCVKVADMFYSQLCHKGHLKFQGNEAALALHHAVENIRKSTFYGGRPLHWAPYVHYGA